MRVAWSEQAATDLEDIADFIAVRDRAAARKLTRRIVGAASLLVRHPLLGRVGRVAGTRELVVSGTSYILPYTVEHGRCLILAVIHSRQEWPDQF